MVFCVVSDFLGNKNNDGFLCNFWFWKIKIVMVFCAISDFWEIKIVMIFCVSFGFLGNENCDDFLCSFGF